MSGEAYITKHFYSEKTIGDEPISLSLVISSASFTYTISTKKFSNIIELCHVEITTLTNVAFNLTDKIHYLINNYLLHQKRFDKVNISFLNNEFTLIPEAYVSENAKDVLKFATGRLEVKRLVQHNLKNIKFCFTADQELISYLEKVFPNAAIRHSGAVSINLLFSQHSLLNANLYLNIADGFIELLAKEKNELLFYNVFNYESNEDILYYLLFIMEQFDLDQKFVKLVISGERPLSDELLQNIKKYIKQVSYSVSDSSVRLKGTLSSLPHHYYFTVLNQHLCAL